VLFTALTRILAPPKMGVIEPTAVKDVSVKIPTSGSSRRRRLGERRATLAKSDHGNRFDAVREPRWHPNAWELDVPLSGRGRLGAGEGDKPSRTPFIVEPSELALAPSAAVEVGSPHGRPTGREGGMTTRLQGPSLTRPATPHDLLRAGLEADPDRPALIAATGRRTFNEVDRMSSRLAANLLTLGLQPGDRVASLMPNRPGLVVHYLACFKAGLVATPLNYRYTATESDHALAVSDASALLLHAERIEELQESRLAGGLRQGWITYGPAEGPGPSFAELVDDAPDAVPPVLPVPDPSAPAMIFFTSGSTGPAKGVTHTHETLGWMMAIGVAGLELSAADLLLAGSSLSHVGAFYVTFAALSVGAAAIVARTFDGDELLPLLREDRPTVLSMLPSALFALTRDHGACTDDFSTLRLCRAAGDSVSAELERKFTALSGFAMDEAYGLTETGLTTVSPPSGLIRIGSIGMAVPGVTLSIRDDEGREIADGAEGRLWIRTASATVGTGTTTRRPPRCSRTAGSIPATSYGRTRTATSTSVAAGSRSSSTTARTSVPRRWRGRCSSTRQSRPPARSAFTTPFTASGSAPTSPSSRGQSRRGART
jgi:long-chain acyl-CoA synthetase